MTATTVTRRTIALAGVVTAGATALTLPFAPMAAADGTQAAPYAPHVADVMGKAPGAGQGEHGDGGGTSTRQDQKSDRSGDRSGDRTERSERSGRTDRTDGVGTVRGGGRTSAAEPQERGRGAEYREDGTVVTIPRHEQPDPVPASDEAIDRWIDEALEIMDEHDIPGTYEGIHSNLMRESSGDPLTINLWDSNAHKNIPSKGLLQVIDPTFEQYHVEGTSNDIFDPVANIVAACNYAADRYGSMDNVDSAY